MLQIVKHQVLDDHGFGKGVVALDERRNCLCDHVLGVAAHFRHLAGDVFQIVVKCCDCMIGHRLYPVGSLERELAGISRNGR